MGDQTITDVFSTSGLQVAVLFVDDNGISHLTPNCDHIKGATKVVTDFAERGWFACGFIPMPNATPSIPQVSGPNMDAPYNGATTAPQSASTERPPWPADLPQASLTDASSVALWLAQVNRKLTAEDVAAIPILKRYATAYVMDETNHTLSNGEPNEFIVSVANACARYDISAGQTKGVLNWWRAQVKRNPPQQNQPTADSGLDLSSLESGMYAVPNGDTRLKVRINKVTKGNWDGWIFVNDGAAYGAQKKYGAQRPGQTYKGEIVEELRTIVADPIAALAAYGKLIGKCGRCGRKLEDKESVERGIGPWCYAKLVGDVM